MGAKKKQISKTDLVTAPSKESSSSLLNFTVTGNLEVDFQEGFRTYADPAPKVVYVDERTENDTEEEFIENKTLEQLFDEKRPKLVAICRNETEGRNQVKTIVGIQVKNWQFLPSDAKILELCLEKHDKVESIQFIRAKISKHVIRHIPASVKFLSIHSNDMTDPELIREIFSKGIPHICLQYNNIGPAECMAIADSLSRSNVVTLNLSGNKIGDQGGKLIARSILMNKKLTAIAMQGCDLGNKTAFELATVLSRQVQMNQSEIVEWRRSRLSQIVEANSQLQLTVQPRSTRRPNSANSSSSAGREKRKQGRRTLIENNPPSTKPNKFDSSKKRKSVATLNEPKKTELNSPVPDETGIERVNGKMFTPGNKILYSINLSRNQIGVDGISSIIDMLVDHIETEKRTEQNSTMLQHVKLCNNMIPKDFCFSSQLKGQSRINEIIQGIGVSGNSLLDILDQRINEIKEDI